MPHQPEASPHVTGVNEFSHRQTRFGAFIFRTVFTPGLATQIIKLYCANALTQKLRSHDVYYVGLIQVVKTAEAL